MFNSSYEDSALIARKRRAAIYLRMGGRCGYCGRPIEPSDMQIDHMQPREYGGTDDDANLICACRQCNNLKNTFSVETFRTEVSRQVERARRDSVNFRTAERFGLIHVTDREVVFYFETIAAPQNSQPDTNSSAKSPAVTA